MKSNEYFFGRRVFWKQRVCLLCLVILFWPSLTAAQIKQSVGVGGENQTNDIKVIQTLLNGISEDSGGPADQLSVSGKLDNTTANAIRRFQRMQLGFQDGLITPKSNDRAPTPSTQRHPRNVGTCRHTD